MKKNMLPILALTLIFISFSSHVFAQEVQKESTLNLTIEDTLNRVEKDNLEINMLNEKIELMYKLYNKDKARVYDMENSDRTDMESKKIKFIYPKQSLQQIENAKHEKDNRLKEIKNDVEKQYLNLVNSDKEIGLTNKSIENINEEIKKTNTNIKEGRAVSSSLEALKLKKVQLTTELNRAKLQKEESLIKIKQYLNIDKEKNINLSPAKKVFQKFNDSHIEDIINKALLKNYDLYSKNKNLEFAKDEKALYVKYGSNSLEEEVNVDVKVKDLENDLQNTKTNVEINLWRAYYDLKAKESTAEIEMLNLENAKSRYNESEIRYKAGAIDKLQLQSSKLELDKQNVTTERAINDYMITVDSFKDNLAGF